MKRRPIFGGNPPPVLRMPAEARPFGWREDLLLFLDPLSDEAFFIRKEPLSKAEARAIARDFDAICRRIEVLPSLEDIAAHEPNVEQPRGGNPGAGFD